MPRSARFAWCVGGVCFLTTAFCGVVVYGDHLWGEVDNARCQPFGIGAGFRHDECKAIACTNRGDPGPTNCGSQTYLSYRWDENPYDSCKTGYPETCIFNTSQTQVCLIRHKFTNEGCEGTDCPEEQIEQSCG
jgi:hypothetical protein